MNETNQKSYLLQVKNKLLFHFSSKEIAAILEDLNQIFMSAKENGETEQEICSRLGKPCEFTENLLCDNPKDRFLPGSVIFILSGIGFCMGIYALYNAYDIFLGRYPVLLYPVWCLPAVFLTVFLWKASGGRSLYAFRQQKKRNQMCSLLSGFLSFLVMLSGQMMVLALHKNGFSEELAAAVVRVSAVVQIWSYLGFFLAVITGIGLFCGEYELLSSFLVLTGSVCSAHLFMLIMKHYSSFFASGWYLPCSLPYAASLFAAFFWKMHEHRRGR